MRRAAATGARVATTAFIIAILLFGTSYLLTSPKVVTTTTISTTTVSTVSTTVLMQSSSQQSRSTTVSTSASTSASPAISHVIIILMENEEYTTVIGNTAAPYQNSLASSYALAANYFAVGHPSLPNYLALIGGSTFGVTSDCLPPQCSLPGSVTTIATLLGSHGLSWREYAESMPTNCSQVDSSDGLYVTKHNPFVYFGAITGDSGTGTTSSYCDSHVVSLDQFWLDLQAGTLPSYSFITPNICDDAHSCPLSTGDQWLSTIVPKIVNSSSFPSTALFITYDEGSPNDTAGGGGQVPCILVSPFAKAGYVSHVEYSHYSLLATVEAIFGLGNLGRNDTSATPMSDLFAQGIPLTGQS